MLHLRNRRRALVFCSLFYSVTLTYAKPTNLAKEVVPMPSPSPSSADVVSYALPGAQTGGRRIIHSRTDDGMWQASARLPSSSQAGGNEHSSTKTDLTFGRTVDFSALDKQRTNRLMSSSWNRNRDDLMQNGDGEGEIDNSENDEEGLLQSVSAISSQVLEKNDDSLENSSEKDVYLHDDNKNKNGNSQKVKNNAEEQDEEENNQSDTEEIISDEEADKQSGSSTSVTSNPSKRITPVMSLDLSSPLSWIGDDIENEDGDDNSVVHKLKSDAYSTTTPKGLTTWSAVNGGISTSSSTYFKGSVQKLPSDHSVSGLLSFSTERAMTTVDMINSKDYMTTDQPPRTTKAKPMSTKPHRKRPHPHIKKVSPSKFVKPTLENVAAHQISSDDNYDTFQLRPIAPENKASPSTSTKYTMPNTRRPLWPGQVQTPTTRRPVNVRQPAFQKITSRPKTPVLKAQTQTRPPVLTLTTPTTTTPPTSTTYYRNPTSSLISPFPMVSLSNMPFMDFVRSQIIPRLGLSLLSFMTTTPLILSLLGAAAGAGRKKRDVTQFPNDGFEQKMIPVEDLDSLNAKWEQIDKAEERKHKNVYKRPNPITPDRYDESHHKESMFTQLLRKLFRSSEPTQKENSSKTS